jgi:hypothetical protein
MKEWPEDERRLKSPTRTNPLTLPRPERMSSRYFLSCGVLRRAGVFVVGQPVAGQREPGDGVKRGVVLHQGRRIVVPKA